MAAQFAKVNAIPRDSHSAPGMMWLFHNVLIYESVKSVQARLRRVANSSGAIHLFLSVDKTPTSQLALLTEALGSMASVR